MYALAVDPPEKSAILVRELALPYDLLCDTSREVVEKYDLLNPDVRKGVAFPAIFIINPQGQIVYRSLDEKVIRADMAEIIIFLQQLQQNPQIKMERKKQTRLNPSVKISGLEE